MKGITVSATSKTACKNSGSFGFLFVTSSIKVVILCDMIIRLLTFKKTFSLVTPNVRVLGIIINTI